ncbi:hypothetical protein QQ045_018161 [Rhodiola kirilowii]
MPNSTGGFPTPPHTALLRHTSPPSLPPPASPLLITSTSITQFHHQNPNPTNPPNSKTLTLNPNIHTMAHQNPHRAARPVARAPSQVTPVDVSALPEPHVPMTCLFNFRRYPNFPEAATLDPNKELRRSKTVKPKFFPCISTLDTFRLLEQVCPLFDVSGVGIIFSQHVFTYKEGHAVRYPKADCHSFERYISEIDSYYLPTHLASCIKWQEWKVVHRLIAIAVIVRMDGGTVINEKNLDIFEPWSPNGLL